MDVTPLPYIPRPQEEARLRTYLLDRLQGKRGVPKALFLGGATGVGKRTLLHHVCAGERRLREFRVVHVLPPGASDAAAEEGGRKALGKAAEIVGEGLNLALPLTGLVFSSVRILMEEQLFGERKAERVGRPPELSILDADGPVLLIVHGIAPEDVKGLKRYARLVREAHHRAAPVTILFLDTSATLRPAAPDGGDSTEEPSALAGLRRFLDDARQLEELRLRPFSEAECRETILGLGLSMEWATVLWQISGGRPAELDALWQAFQRRRATERWRAGERPVAKPAWKLARDLAIHLLDPRMPPDTVHEPRLVRSLFLAAAMGTAFLPQAVAECAHEADPRRDDGDREAWEDLWIDVLEHEGPAHPPLAASRRADGVPEILTGDERRFFVYELRHPALVNVLRAALRSVWDEEESPTDGENEALERQRLVNGCRAIEAWLERSFRESWSQALEFRAALLHVQNRDREAIPLEDLARRLRLEASLRTEVERERRRVEGGEDARGLFACLSWYGDTLYKLGHVRLAADAMLEAKEIADAPDAALPDGERCSLLSFLGVLLTRDGMYAEAAPILSEAWSLASELFGPEAPDTLTVIHNFASLLNERGEYAEAEPLYRWVLGARERVLGPEHPRTLGTLEMLATLLDRRGSLSAAEPLFRRVLTGRERVLGPDHPDTLRSISTLAYLLDSRGDPEASEPLYRRVLAAQERVLGPEHPDTLRSVHNFALLLDRRGDSELAESLSRRALAGSERVLGPDHPDTLTSANNLASLLYDRDPEAAEPLFRRALAGRERVLGPDHPDTLRSVNNLAHLLYNRGDPKAAEPLYRRVFETRERVLGPDHPDTLAAFHHLAAAQQPASTE